MTSLPGKGAEEKEFDRAFERIVPVAPVRATDAPRRISLPSAQREVPAVAVVIGLVILFLVAGGVFTFLSWPREERGAPAPVDVAVAPRSQGVPAAPVEAPPPDVKKPAPWDDPELLRARQAAQDFSAEFETRIEALRAHAVERWAASELAAAEAAREKGRAAFEARDYRTAADAHERSVQQLDTLIERVPAELAQALKRASDALDRGDSPAAIAAYNLALAIEPGNAAATRGRSRVQSLPQLMTMLGEADAAERANQMEAAAERYRAALKLDPDSAAAQTGLARVQGRIAEAAFQRAMAEGLAALDRGDHAGAQAAYARAQKMRPDSAAVREGLSRAGTGLTNTRIAGLLAEADARGRAEDWNGAVERYRSALNTDASLAQARAGLSRSEARADLAARLQSHVKNPQRLQAENVYADAERALGEARAITPASPMLSQQIAALERTLSLATTPVTVRLQSDKETQVTVYKVGELGRFDARELTLKPGRYVAVGTRAGYRDVRREFEVAADGPVSAIIVRCEERI